MRAILNYIRSCTAAWRDYPADPGRILGGHYLVQALLGEGSYGLTYQCADLQDGRLVAVKMARPSKGALGIRLLEQEAQVLRSLEHPRIPTYHGMLEEQGRRYLVMGYVRGDPVEHLIFDQGRRFTEGDCVELALQLLELATFLHAQGIAHMDMRVPNAIVRDGALHLIDFGLARPFGSDSLVEPARPASPQADLEDIGHFMLFVLYSAFDPSGREAETVDGGTAVPLSWREELSLSPDLRQMLERLLQLQEPYASAEDALRELRRIGRQIGSSSG